MKVFQPINYSLRLHEIFSSLRIDNSKRKSRTMLNRSTLPLLTRNSINVPLGIHSEINAGRSSHSANPRHCSTLSCFRFAQIPNVFAMEYNCKKRKSGCYACMKHYMTLKLGTHLRFIVIVAMQEHTEQFYGDSFWRLVHIVCMRSVSLQQTIEHIC